MVLSIYAEVDRIKFCFIFGVLKLGLILPHEIIGEQWVALQEHNDNDAQKAIDSLSLVLKEFKTL